MGRLCSHLRQPWPPAGLFVTSCQEVQRGCLAACGADGSVFVSKAAKNGRERGGGRHTVLAGVSVAALKHCDQRASWGGKGFFGLHFHIAVHF